MSEEKWKYISLRAPNMSINVLSPILRKCAFSFEKAISIRFRCYTTARTNTRRRALLLRQRFVRGEVVQNDDGTWLTFRKKNLLYGGLVGEDKTLGLGSDGKQVMLKPMITFFTYLRAASLRREPCLFYTRSQPLKKWADDTGRRLKTDRIRKPEHRQLP